MVIFHHINNIVNNILQAPFKLKLAHLNIIFDKLQSQKSQAESHVQIWHLEFSLESHPSINPTNPPPKKLKLCIR